MKVFSKGVGLRAKPVVSKVSLLVRVLLAAAALTPILSNAQETQPIRLLVDLTDAPRHLIHITEQIPVHAGASTFSYPQWIPGEELPAGPIDNLAGLTFRASSPGGAIVPWRRDLTDLYAFHVLVPEGVSQLSVAYDILDVPSRANTTATGHTSSHVVMLEPSEVVMYPGNMAVRDIPVTATIHMPAGWQAATALRTSGTAGPSLNGPGTTFQTVSVEQLVDSPILAGDHCRQYPLAPGIHPAHMLDVCTEKAADLDLQPALLAHLSALAQQAGKLFAGHHYDHYDFLVAASSHLQGDSKEHTQSADYIVRSLDIADPANASFLGNLLPHEYAHAWCGKYRRPVGIATRDYHVPMQNDLIWVYEGLTEYYGDVLAVRAGFLTPALGVQQFNYELYDVDKPGRRWRSVQDTADASAILRGTDAAWAGWRRGQDYYREGALLWLEADVKIRQLTRGRKSLDDFAALFFSPEVPGSSTHDTGPGVLPYSFADVVNALNAIAPYDWQSFWETRLNAITLAPPTAGLIAAGYDSIDQETMTPEEASFITPSHMAEMYHSLGFQVMPDSTLQDVWMDSPAFTAGLGPGDKLTTINGKPYSADVLTSAVKEAKTSAGPITITALRDDEAETFKIQYHGGEKYAALRRNGNPDLLTVILQAK